jgi:tetratricopeptide (TPR) repeat protein
LRWVSRRVLSGQLLVWVTGFAVLLGGTVLGAQSVDEAIALGNAAYRDFDNRRALEHYLEAVKEGPSHPEALWKAARAYADVGKSVEEGDRSQAKELYLKGEDLAHKAVELDPDSADAHFALAMCVGRHALFEGGKTKIRLSEQVKAEAERAIALDANHDGAYHILGLWHYNIATLGWTLRAFAKLIYGGVPPGASLESAAEMFSKAIEIDESRPVHHLEYARTLIGLGRYSEAREHLRRCIALPRVQWDDPEHQAEAAKMLDEIENKKDES